MSSYCRNCKCETIKYNKLEYIEEDGRLYAHDICPECGDKFYSPALPFNFVEYCNTCKDYFMVQKDPETYECMKCGVIYQDCPTCLGSTHLDKPGSPKCPTCNGKGVVEIN